MSVCVCACAPLECVLRQTLRSEIRKKQVFPQASCDTNALFPSVGTTLSPLKDSFVRWKSPLARSLIIVCEGHWHLILDEGTDTDGRGLCGKGWLGTNQDLWLFGTQSRTLSEGCG